MTTLWRLQLSGAARLACGDRGDGSEAPPRVLPLSRKDAGWLAYAALDTNAASQQVASLLWPEADARGALNSLRQRVHRLRKASGARLVEMAAHIRLASDLRLHEPDTATLLAQNPDAEPGTLLAGHEYDAETEFSAWLASAREAQAGMLRETLARLAGDAEARAALASALRYARRLLAADRLSEHAHRRLMRLHYLRGDKAAAVAAFEDCEAVLKDELGLKPSAETLQLLHTIEQARSVALHAPAPEPASLARPPRLVGRNALLAELALAEQQGQVAVLVGEAGMGKTRLLQERLAGRADALHVQARPGDEAVPYGTLGRLLQALPGHGADATALSAATPQHLQRVAEARLVQAGLQGLQLLAADDLHFADRASIELLLVLTQAQALSGLRWVLAQRPAGAADAAGALLNALAESPQARWLVLKPLNEAELAELLGSLALPAFDAATWAGALARHTGGNPLFVIETLRAALQQRRAGAPTALLPRPAGLSHLIDQRLRRLSRPALALARVAAVAAPDFSLALAEHTLGTSAIVLADAWQELEDAQVLRGEAFAHDLVHEAALRAMPQVIAAHTHRQVAEFLADRNAEPARLAHHWLAAGRHVQAAQCLQQAAHNAQQARRPREQAQLLQDAAAALHAAGDAQAAWQARLDSVSALLQAGGVAQALALAAQLQDEAGTDTQRAHGLAMHALALMWAGRAAEADTAAQQALAMAHADDADVGVTAVSVLAVSRALRGDSAAAVALMQPWVDRVEAVRDPMVQLNFFGNLTNVLLQADRSAQALPVAQRHLALARRCAHGGEQVTALMNLSNLHGRRGELVPAIEHAREADRLMADASAAATMSHWNRTSLAYFLCGEGQFAEALGLFDPALAAFASDGHNPVLLAMAQDCAARAWLTLGQLNRAQALVRDDGAQLPSRLRARRLGTRALLHQATGQAAGPLLQAVLEQVGPSDPVRIAAEIELALEAAPAEAATQLSALQRRAEDAEYHPLSARAAALRLPCLQTLGRNEELADLLPLAEQGAQRARGAHVYLPELLMHCHQAWWHLGRPRDAARCLEAAMHWVHHVALPHVPSAFVESFLYRNTINLRLRSLAQQRAR